MIKIENQENGQRQIECPYAGTTITFGTEIREDNEQDGDNK